LNLGGIKHVGRLTGVKLDVVGHVDGVVDGTNADGFEFCAQPLRALANRNSLQPGG
jgi:hypothetical protein